MELERRDIIDVIKTGDLSRLNDEQQLWYYVHECQRMGLDPAARPLVWARLQGGKLVLYADRRCGDMLAAKHGVSTEIVEGPCVKEFGDTRLLFCRARARMPDGRVCEDVGTLPIQDLVNGVMKVLTKAVRRATLRLCGWGGLDESELDTIPGGAMSEAPSKQLAAPAPATPPIASSDLLDRVRDDCEALGVLVGDVGPDTVRLDGERRLLLLEAATIAHDHRGVGSPEEQADAFRVLYACLARDGSKAALIGAIAALRTPMPQPPARPTTDGELLRAALEATTLAALEEIAGRARAQMPPASEVRRQFGAVYLHRVKELGGTPTRPPRGGKRSPEPSPPSEDDPEREAIAAEGTGTAALDPTQALRGCVASKASPHELQSELRKPEHAFVDVPDDTYRSVVAERLVQLGMSSMAAVNACRVLLNARHGRVRAA